LSGRAAASRVGPWLVLTVVCWTAACFGGGAPRRERPSIPPVTVPQAPSRVWRGSTVHVVERGETLYRISQRYGTTVAALMTENGIDDPHNVPTGTRLIVPTGVQLVSARRGDAHTYARRDPRGIASGEPEFGWPLDGQLLSSFGRRHGRPHDGIDIKAAKGTLVHAAEAGRVLEADAELSGYGKCVIIKHSGRLSSVYAHNRKLLVHPGEFVEKGQPIAEVGETGNATTPHLHFEIRSDGTPRDPLSYLRQ
jgi:murein DD-endopeptidase MepM/ murein hydrolase activator NlpD